MTMPWIFLITAGFLEVAWAIGLKYSDGFTRLVPTVLTALGMIVSFFLLSQSLKQIPLGTAYAVWTGIGAVGTAIVGMMLFHEPKDVPRIVCIVLVVAGIAGLKFFAKS